MNVRGVRQSSRLINLPVLIILVVETTSFGKNSIRHNALLSWNFIQAMLTAKLSDSEDIKSDLKKCIVASYYLYTIPTIHNDNLSFCLCLCRLVRPVLSLL